MRPIVLKFGGTSVGSTGRIRAVAEIAKEFHSRGELPVLVVSAMSGETDRLLSLTRDITRAPNSRELDQILACGEQVAVGLVALALQAIGLSSQSLAAHQVPIFSDANFGNSEIKEIPTELLRSLIDRGTIPVITGFQGVTAQGDTTTLGRGGSDLSAVAVAAALGVPCHIYTDVAGVYSADPRLCPAARVMPEISFEEMLEFADVGAKVLYARSVSYAQTRQVDLYVRSTFSQQSMTRVVQLGDLRASRPVSGVALRTDLCAVLVNSHAKIGSELLGESKLADKVLNFWQLPEADSFALLVPDSESSLVMAALNEQASALNIRSILPDRDVTLVSAVGPNSNITPATLNQLAQIAKELGAPVVAQLSKEFSCSILTRRKYGENLLRQAHKHLLESS